MPNKPPDEALPRYPRRRFLDRRDGQSEALLPACAVFDGPEIRQLGIVERRTVLRRGNDVNRRRQR